MREDAASDKGDIRKQRNIYIRKALFYVFVVCHNRPAGRFNAVADKKVYAQAEGGKRKTGNILVCLEGNGKHREQKAEYRAGKKGNEYTHAQAVCVTAEDITEYRADSHRTLYTEVKAARFFNDDFADGTVEKRNVEYYNIMNE